MYQDIVDLYMQVQQNQKKKEKEDEKHLKKLEEGLLNEYKYYKKRKDNGDFCAENLVQEATNKALEQVKDRYIFILFVSK